MPPNALYYGAQGADLIRDRGRIEAQRAATKGATLASAFQAAPRALAGFVQTRDARRAAAQAEAERAADRQWQGQQRQRTMADWGREDALRDAARKVPLLPDGTPDYKGIAAAVGQVDPLEATKYHQLDAEKETRGKALAKERAETIAKEVGATTDQASWDAALNRLAKKAIHVPEVAREFSVANREAMKTEATTYVQWLETQKPEPLVQRDPTRNLEGSITGKIVRPGVPKKDEPEPGTPKDRLISLAKEMYPGRPWPTLTGTQKAAVEKKAKELTTTTDEALMQVTEEDPVTGEIVTSLVPRRAGVVSRKPPKNTDDPELPLGVQRYIYELTRKKGPAAALPGPDGTLGAPVAQPYTAEEAEDEIARAWPELVKAHPKLNPLKIKEAIRKAFGKGAVNVDLGAVLGEP